MRGVVGEVVGELVFDKLNKNSKNEQSVGRKIGIYVVVGIMTFTMIFSVFAGLVAAMN